MEDYDYSDEERDERITTDAVLITAEGEIYEISDDEDFPFPHLDPEELGE